ncbi:MAG: methyltransferase [Candidatus Woesearchaeota archaeon]|jgi:release factor glutamine methyltransferase|nr:methyltransferase [Candidatus Woesearchaeota archaeon]
MKKVYDKIYEPAEDSENLLKNALIEIKKLNKEKLEICEVGVGSGFVISNIAKKYPNNNFHGTDINPDAINFTKKEFEKISTKINLKKTNLLESINKNFDIILFNTPYLPCEEGEIFKELTLKDKAIYGGKNGYEVIEEFIYQIYDKLESENGFVLMLFSSQSNVEYIKKILKLNFYDFEIIDKKTIFFEDLFVMKIKFSDMLRRISTKGVENVKYLDKGKHSMILDGTYKNKKCIIKIGEYKDIQIENLFLEKLQNEIFIPELYNYENEFSIREKLEGQTIKEFLERSKSKNDVLNVLNNCINATQRLDELGINKFEMTNPYKHIYIDKKLKVKFIDFERCIYTNKAKNTTQFFQYIRRYKLKLSELDIKVDEEKILDISKRYKESNFKFTIKDILTP